MHFEIWDKVVQYRVNGSGEMKGGVRRYWVPALCHGWEEVHRQQHRLCTGILCTPIVITALCTMPVLLLCSMYCSTDQWGVYLHP